MKNKKVLYGCLLGLDLAITVALFVLAIVMIVTLPRTAGQWEAARNRTDLVSFMQTHTTVYLLVGVLPLFLLLALNVYLLITYLKKTSAKKKVELSELSEEQKEALRKELLNDLEKK